MHTNETLSKLSDDRISKLVTQIVLEKSGHKSELWRMMTFIDYCNDPAHIMPIAFENRIGIEWSYKDERGAYWQAGGSNQGKPGPFERFDSINKNPLRAICEVYILMNQEK